MKNTSLNSSLTDLMTRTILFLFLLFLTSCSLKTLYNNLDNIIPAYIDRMVDLDNELSDLLDLRIDTFLEWHRSDQLPKYSEWLERIKAKLKNDKMNEIKQKEVLSLIDQSSRFWSDIRGKVSPELARLFPLLSDEQVDELFENLSDSNEEFIEKNISLSKKEKEQLYEERLLDFFEDWLGYLNEDQLKIVKNSSSGFQTLSNLRLNARLEWQRETREILISENTTNKPQKLESLFLKLSKKQDKQYAKVNIENKQLLTTIIVNLLKTMKKDQQQHTLTRLNYYIELFNDLKKRSKSNI